MLRTTMATAAAAMGGADAITVLPYSTPLGRPDAFARRIARNTQIVLMEESALGRVADPAGGSWFVEKLSDDLAAAAWKIFQEIEADGGIVAALASGRLQGMIAAAADARAKQIATGRQELTGVSAFPSLGDDGVKAEPWPAAEPVASGGTVVEPLPQRRLGAPFEALRDRADCAAAGGKPLRIFLANLGSLAEFNVRATWIKNYLAVGGIAAVDTGAFTASGDAAAAFAASGAEIACICSSDANYALLGEATAQALKSAGAREVCPPAGPGNKKLR
jgi:methylmalonyl-CoA mutase